MVFAECLDLDSSKNFYEEVDAKPLIKNGDSKKRKYKSQKSTSTGGKVAKKMTMKQDSGHPRKEPVVIVIDDSDGDESMLSSPVVVQMGDVFDVNSAARIPDHESDGERESDHQPTEGRGTVHEYSSDNDDELQRKMPAKPRARIVSQRDNHALESRKRYHEPPPLNCLLSLFCIPKEVILSNIFPFMEYKEKDDFALVSKHCNEIRCDPSVIRRRKIICKRGRGKGGIFGFLASMKQKKFVEKFGETKTHLKIEGLAKHLDQVVPADHDNHLGDFTLTGVEKLDISCDPKDLKRGLSEATLVGLSIILPNVKEVDMSNVRANRVPSSSRLTRLAWNGVNGLPTLDGTECFGSDSMPNLSDLRIDECTFQFDHDKRKYTEDKTDDYMFSALKKLERLSIGNAMFVDDNAFFRTYAELPQEMLIEMVRRHPSLRWLRSDLSAENVAMLKQERPHITFVSYENGDEEENGTTLC